MTCCVDVLRVRRILGRTQWTPPSPFGDDGWWLDRIDDTARVLVSDALVDGVEWIHASMSRRDRVPDYDELVLLHRSVFGGGWAYQVFAPPEQHINIHQYCLHLWGRVDGKPVLPDFASDTRMI